MGKEDILGEMEGTMRTGRVHPGKAGPGSQSLKDGKAGPDSQSDGQTGPQEPDRDPDRPLMAPKIDR